MEEPSGSPVKVLALTAVDVSTSKPPHRDWGVFGLGTLGGRSAVISTFRLKRGAKSREHLVFRIATTAVHEVGHMLGLEHCEEPRCVMQDAHGSIRNTDSSTGRPGPACRTALDRRSPRIP